jgi:hypothetical protein
MKYKARYLGGEVSCGIGVEGQVWIWDQEKGQVTMASSDTAHAWVAENLIAAPKVKKELVERLYNRSLVGYKPPQLSLTSWKPVRS